MAQNIFNAIFHYLSLYFYHFLIMVIFKTFESRFGHRCHGGVICRHYPPPWSLFLGPTPPLEIKKSKMTAGRQPSRHFDFQTSFSRHLDGQASFYPPPKKNGDTPTRMLEVMFYCVLDWKTAALILVLREVPTSTSTLYNLLARAESLKLCDTFVSFLL